MASRIVTPTRNRTTGMNDPVRGAGARNSDFLAPPERARQPTESFVSAYDEQTAHVSAPGEQEEPKVRDFMTTDVWSCRADRTLVGAATAMHRGDCRFLPVLDAQGRVIAAITDGDICEIGTTDHRPLRHIFVSEAMSRRVFSCRADDGVSQVLETMKRQRIRHLPVVDAEGRPVGVVSLTDVILCMEEASPEIAQSLRPRVAEVLRVTSQKERGKRTVRVNAFRED